MLGPVGYDVYLSFLLSRFVLDFSVVDVIALTPQLTKFDSRSLKSTDLDERDSPASLGHIGEQRSIETVLAVLTEKTPYFCERFYR